MNKRKYISLKEFKKDPTQFSQQDIVWLCSKQKLSESFIRKMKDYLIWNLICTYQDISEEFMSEMENYLDWRAVSANQQLSEEFMDKFKDKLEWETITHIQDFSEDFAWEHINYIDVRSLFYYHTNNLTDELSDQFYRALIQNYWDEGNRDLLVPSYCGKHFDKDFIREFAHVFNYEIIDLFKDTDKTENEKLFLEFQDKIDEPIEWNFFIMKNAPSLNFLLRYKENYKPVIIPSNSYSKEEQEVIKQLK